MLTTGLIVNTDTGDAIRASAEEFAALLDSADGFLVKNYELPKILHLGRTGRDDFTIETDDSLNPFNTETARFLRKPAYPPACCRRSFRALNSGSSHREALALNAGWDEEMLR